MKWYVKWEGDDSAALGFMPSHLQHPGSSFWSPFLGRSMVPPLGNLGYGGGLGDSGLEGISALFSWS